jgi:predicted PurR-regulated permease PerM
VLPLAAFAAWAIAIGLFLFFFDSIQGILLGVLAASAVAALLRPVVRWLPGPRAWIAVGVWLAFLIICAGVAALAGWLLSRPIQSELQNWPQVKQNINVMLQHWSAALGMSYPLTVELLIDQTEAFLFSSKGASVVSATTNITADVIIAVAFFFIGSLYIMVAKPGELTDPVIRLLPRSKQPALRGMLNDLDPGLRWWALGALTSIVIVGALSWGGYRIAGVEFSASLALMMGISEIVPTVGPFTAFLITLVLALAQGPMQAIGVSIVYLIVHLVESYFLHPYIMKRAVHIPPVLTLFTVVFWGKVLGLAGLLLAVPIDLVIWAAADHFIGRRHHDEHETNLPQRHRVN